MYICIYMYMHTCIHVYTLYIYIYIYINIYIYIYIYIYIHIYIYTYIDKNILIQSIKSLILLLHSMSLSAEWIVWAYLQKELCTIYKNEYTENTLFERIVV